MCTKIESENLKGRDHVTVDLREMGCEDIDWIHLA
jgi:hypothetical protein